MRSTGGLQSPDATFDEAFRPLRSCAQAVRQGVDARSGGDWKVVATEDVRVGSVLLVERAYAFESMISAPPEHPMNALLSFGAEKAMRSPEDEEALRLFGDPEVVEALSNYLETDSSFEGYLERRFGDDEAAMRAFLQTFTTKPSSLRTKASNVPIEKLVEAVYTANVLPLALGSCGLLYGKGMFEVACRINHSCEPNAEYISHGRYLILYALCDIARGEEICITYLSDVPCYARETRRKMLSARLDFDCGCPRCAREDGKRVELPQVEMFNLTQKWRFFSFKKIPEIDRTSPTAAATTTRRDVYKLGKVFLEQHRAELFSDKSDGPSRLLRLRSFVVAACAIMLLPAHAKLIDDPRELTEWAQFYRMAYPLLFDAIQRHKNAKTEHEAEFSMVTRWMASLAAFARFVNETFIRPRGGEALPPLQRGTSLDTDHLSRLCLEQYVKFVALESSQLARFLRSRTDT